MLGLGPPDHPSERTSPPGPSALLARVARAYPHGMTVLVVFESYWGNTEQVAHAVAAGLRDERVEALVVSVAQAPRTLDVGS